MHDFLQKCCDSQILIAAPNTPIAYWAGYLRGIDQDHLLEVGMVRVLPKYCSGRHIPQPGPTNITDVSLTYATPKGSSTRGAVRIEGGAILPKAE